MIHYILQVILFQLLLLVVYDVFLKRETFFSANRIYLLATSVLSFVLPFIKIEAIQQSIPQEFRVQLPAVIIGETTGGGVTSAPVLLDGVLIAQQGISWSTFFIGLYAIGVVLSVVLFVLKLRKLYRLKQSATSIIVENYTIATVPNTHIAFTFLKTIFLGEHISETQKTHILQHELVHVKQRHTLDLLFYEVLRILFWFNPLVYVFQKKIRELHEYTADRLVASQDKAAYYQKLLSGVFGTTEISFINTFYKSSFIKNRIVMLQKSKSKKIVQLRYLLLIPAVCAMVLYTSCAEDASTQNADLVSKIENLSAELSSKDELSEEEKSALGALIYNHYPKDVKGIPGEKGEIHFDKDRKHFKTEGVPFGTLDRAPIFPGCDAEASEEENKKCFTDMVSKEIVENFNTKLANDHNLSGRQRISVQFIINEQGNLTNIRARAANPILEKEAMRVVSNLPKMIPGEHGGKTVSVLYALPIIFEIDE
ncbi:M56 family metallopeptidase [Marinirhabdus gelatinilytica]|uniref:TonB-like protein n=1 Tax=Marinirhabdus gelatinilytica TaxID=1703343 RepID=A0A370QKP1_9FLAO|nr:M56 family metallopeptidase [Marinirhabdus gelatinilytica]RDK88881.1 TonB-like protein [Marinirhabdus gelatinilytica]